MDFNKDLIITDSTAKALVNEIENIPLHFGQLPLPEHKDFPAHNRFMRVLGIDVKTYTEFAVIIYAQVGLHKETGDELILPLECPKFEIYKYTWNYLRKPDGSFFTAKNKVGEDEKIKVPSLKYMIWLSEHGKTINDLISGYLPAFVEAVGEKLNEKKNILF